MELTSWLPNKIFHLSPIEAIILSAIIAFENDMGQFGNMEIDYPYQTTLIWPT